MGSQDGGCFYCALSPPLRHTQLRTDVIPTEALNFKMRKGLAERRLHVKCQDKTREYSGCPIPRHRSRGNRPYEPSVEQRTLALHACRDCSPLMSGPTTRRSTRRRCDLRWHRLARGVEICVLRGIDVCSCMT